jgi:tetratricopeptide (TPR) repeat protein
LLDVMARAIDHSLVKVLPGEDTRYCLLYTVREYPRHRLPPATADKLARRHAEFFLSVAAENGPHMYGPGGETRFVRIDSEYDNLRAALEWARNNPDGHEIGLRIASNLSNYWLRRGRWREGLVWLEELLERAGGAPPAVMAQALAGVGNISYTQKELQKAREAFEQSVALYRTTDDDIALGATLEWFGQVIRDLGDLTTAKRLTEEAITILRRDPRSWNLAHALKDLGEVARFQGRLDEAAALYEESAAILRRIPSPWLVAIPLGLRGTLAASQGLYDQAEPYWRESLVWLEPLQDDWYVSGAIEGMAQVVSMRGDDARAARLFGAAEALREGIDRGAAEHWPLRSSRFVKKLRISLGEAALSALWAEGRSLTRAGAIAVALAECETCSKQPRALS